MRTPSTEPITIASSPSQNPSPSTIASAPVKTPVMLTCGANHTVKSRPGVPYRWSSAMGAMPCVSTDMSPAAAGRRPLKIDRVSGFGTRFDMRLTGPGDRAELPARRDAELDEDLPQVPFDGVRADEQLRADLLIRQAVAGQPRDLPL